MQLSEDEDILTTRDAQENPDGTVHIHIPTKIIANFYVITSLVADTTAMETGDRCSVKRKKSLKDDHSASEGLLSIKIPLIRFVNLDLFISVASEQQPRKSPRLAAVQTKTHRNDDEEEDNEKDSLDSFISTDSTASSGIGSVLQLYSLANDEPNN